jgi:hypothetical protein
MFAYQPTPDRSGEILGAGQMQAAQTNAQMMGQLGQDIGGALAGIGEMYGEIEGNKAKGRAFKDVFKVVGPTMGMSLEQLEGVAGGKIKSDMDWYNVRETMSPFLPALINLQLGQDRLGVQRNQPFINTALDDMANTASGNRTVTPGSPMPAGADDPANTVPLPEADTPLPAVQGAPGQVRSVPGGRASWDARNRDRQKQGLQPLPYPPGLE